MTRFGTYILDDLLARGGMAEVHLAHKDGPEGFRKRLAIKCILGHLGDQADFRTMFLDEARLVAKLNHPNIVQLFDMGQVQGQLYLAMEFIDGLSLARILRICADKTIKIPQELVAHIMAEVCLGLDYAHNFEDEDGRHLNIIHRDVSPHNIMLTREGMVKMVDFGIAKAATNIYRTNPSSMKGKLRYMSPEQIKGTEKLDRRTDVYSCGVVLFEMFTMRAPHEADSDLELMSRIAKEEAPSLQDFAADLDDELVALVARCLERDRERRIQDCRELRNDLLNFLKTFSENIDSYTVKDFLHQLDHSETKPEGPGDIDAPDPMGERSVPTLEEASPRKGSPPVILLVLGALALVGLALGLTYFLSPESTAPPAATRLPPETDWAQQAAERKLEKQRQEFHKLWLRGQELANKPDMQLAAVTVLERADELGMQIKLEEATQRSVRELLARSRQAYKRQEQQERTKARQEEEQRKRKELERKLERLKHSGPAVTGETALKGPRKEKFAEYRRLGIKAHGERKLAKAIRYYKKALKIDPDAYDCYRLIGAAYALDGKRAEAYSFYKTYVSKCPRCLHAPSVRKILKDYEAWTQ